MRRIAPVLLTALLLAGCNGDSDDKADGKKSPTNSATPRPTGPACEGIWKAGETLPEGYTSCVLDGAIAVQETYDCEDGTTLVAFNDSMYAVTGGTILEPEIQPFQDTEEYGKLYSECTGE